MKIEMQQRGYFGIYSKVDRLGRIYNCGGWVMHNDKNYHPACRIFAVDEEGDEYLHDVSYKDVKVGGDNRHRHPGKGGEHRLGGRARSRGGRAKIRGL